jgi:hypothetical protein
MGRNEGGYAPSLLPHVRRSFLKLRAAKAPSSPLAGLFA